MKASVFFCVVALSITCVFGQEPRELTEWQRIGAMRFDDRRAAIAEFDSEKKTRLISEIKSAGMDNKDSLLLHLGDGETIKKYTDSVTEMREVEWALRLLQTAYDPRVIEGIAPVLFTPFKFGSGLDYPLPWRVSYAMLHVLGQAPGFSDEVYEWQKRMEQGHPVQIFPMMQGWWRMNEAHFRGGNYQAVKPGETPLPAREWADKFDASVKPDGTLAIKPVGASPPPALPNKKR